MDHIFYVALLGRGQVMIEQKQVGRNERRSSSNFLKLPASDQSSGIGAIAALQDFASNFSARAGGEIAQFGQRFFSAKLRIRNRSGFCRRRGVTSSLCSAGQARGYRTLAGSVLEAYQERALLAHSWRKILR
jgi:hypothetical protein